MAKNQFIITEEVRLRFARKNPEVGDNGCKEWPGPFNQCGYGLIPIPKLKNQLAHRVAYRIYHGDIPEGFVIRHSCDNPKCVNPDHLIAGTQAENVADMMAKSRHVSTPRPGELNGASKLTLNNVLSIRKSVSDGVKQRTLAREFSVSESTISMIVSRKRWGA